MISNKYVDTTSIIQVIGNVYNHPSLLDQDEKYIVTENDFTDKFHRIIFGAIYKLHELGAKKITLENISDFLSSRPKSEAIYTSQKGEEWLLNASKNADIDSFDYYYSRLKKMSLLRAYNNCGIDVTDIYDPDNILDSKKKQRQEEYLDNSTLEDIATRVDKKINAIKLEYVDAAFGESVQAAEGIDNLIDKFKEHPEVGIPLYGPLINTVTRGARLKKFYLRSAASGTGKALPNDQIIPTPSGYKTVGEVKEGDYLFTENSNVTKVVKVHPQPRKKKKFSLLMEDGREIECCKDHLWTVETIHGEVTETTEQVRNRIKRKERVKIKRPKCAKMKKRNTNLDPYAVGMICGSMINEIPGILILYFPEYDDVLKFCSLTNASDEEVGDNKYIFYNEDGYIEKKDIFQDGMLKEQYLFNSKENRMKLLNGFLDVTASINKNGNISFTFVSKEIEESFKQLIWSLGYYFFENKPSRWQRTQNGIDYSTFYLKYPISDIALLFEKKSKKKLFNTRMSGENYLGHNFEEYIDIIKVKEHKNGAVNMTCFTVDNPTALFLCKDYIVTHNTRSMIADACYFSCDEIFDENFGWIKNNAKQPTLFISTEQELEEVQTMMLAFISNVNEEHILNGNYEKAEEERVRRAAKVLKRAPLYIETIPDFSLDDIEDAIKRNIHEHDIKYLVHDYIHSSIKILSEVGGKAGIRLREDNILFMLSTRLKDLCNQYGIFILSATQLNAGYVDSETPDQNLLRGSKSIADKVDFGCILLSVKDSDIDALQPILTTGVFEKPDLKISIYKNRRGRYKSIYLWCKADLGTCRIKPMFATNWSYEIMTMNDLKIEIEDSAF